MTSDRSVASDSPAKLSTSPIRSVATHRFNGSASFPIDVRWRAVSISLWGLETISPSLSHFAYSVGDVRARIQFIGAPS